MNRSRYLLFAVDWLVLCALNLPLGNGFALSIILPVLMMIGVYAFRCFDIEALASGRSTLFRTFLGALFGLFPFYLSYPFIGDGVNEFTVPYNIIACFLSLSLVHKITYVLFLRSFPVTRMLLIGKSDGVAPILRDIEKRTLAKLVFVEFDERTGLLEEKIGNGHQAVLALDPQEEARLSIELDRLKAEGLQVFHLPRLCETYLQRIPIEVIQRNPIYYKLVFENIKDEPLTRFIDITVSILILTIVSPVLLLASLLIIIEDGFPVLFRQKRIGRYEVPFTIHKLRTLRGAKINHMNPNIDIEKRSLLIGRLLRRTRMDELLNFVNVIKGEMSIVGPRPEMEQFHFSARKSIPYYTSRLLVKPGVTGWAQLRYKHTSSMEDYKIKTEYDLYYIKNRSILLDLKIMLKTFETMIGLRGR